MSYAGGGGGRLLLGESRHGRAQMLLFHGNAEPMRRLDGGGGVKRKPFFSCKGGWFGDESHDQLLAVPEKKRRLLPEQAMVLEKNFEAERRLEPELKAELARQLGLQPRQVAVWFQNRRARHRAKHLEQDLDQLKSDYAALAADHRLLLDDNHRLRLQLYSLTEQLERSSSMSTTAPAAGSSAAAHFGGYRTDGSSACVGESLSCCAAAGTSPDRSEEAQMGLWAWN